LIFWCFGCSCLQATGDDFNVEEGGANGHLGLFLMWVWSGLQLETEFSVPWRYLSTYVFCAYSHSFCIII
jgi:hypothetical protein